MESIMEDIIKKTYDTPKSNESEEVKLKKYNEYIYNMRLLWAIKQAIDVAACLHLRHTCPIQVGSMSHQKAKDFASILQQAYSGHLEPI